MEMVETRLMSLRALALACALALAVSCDVPGRLEGSHVRMSWKAYDMDGSRTGVRASSSDNVPQTMGSFENGVYRSPSGCDFTGGSVPGVAEALLEVQPQMSLLKQVIGYCPLGMVRHSKQSELANWTADVIRDGVSGITGKRVDVGIINKGGIRKDMPKGDVLYDDIVSMFPFNNNLCRVELYGRDLRALLDDICAKKMPVVLSGVKMTVDSLSLVEVTVGGREIAPDAVYSVGTVDFLLDGGDDIFVARNSRSLEITGVLVKEWMLAYVKELSASGKFIEGIIDDRLSFVEK